MLIKEQFNVASEGRRCALALPRIKHEYVLLWRKPERAAVFAAAGPAQGRG